MLNSITRCCVSKPFVFILRGAFHIIVLELVQTYQSKLGAIFCPSVDKLAIKRSLFEINLADILGISTECFGHGVKWNIFGITKTSLG